MIVIRFEDIATKSRALGFLAGRFPFKSWASGEMPVPEDVIAYIATEGIVFSVEGPATYERLISSVRDSTSSKVTNETINFAPQ